MNDSPFHRHPSLLGLLCSLAAVTVLGALTHWRNELIPVYIIAVGVSFVLLARLFYGLRAARALDEERVAPGSGWNREDTLSEESRALRLASDYEEAQKGDVMALERIAEEEQSR